MHHDFQYIGGNRMNYSILAEDLLLSMARRKLPTERSGHISSGEIGILSYLAFKGEGALSGEISREVGISTGRTAIALKNLEKKGYVRRSHSSKDRRCVLVSITEQGSEYAQSVRDYTLKVIESMLEYLGPEDAESYVRILKRLLSAELPLPPGKPEE